MNYTLHYYDLVLLGIAGSLALGAGIGVATAVPTTVSIPLFGLVAIAIIGHGLFVNGPVDEVAELTEEVEPEEVPGVSQVARIVE